MRKLIPCRLVLGLLGLLAATAVANAAPRLSQEPTDMHAGQKVFVDDGTCPSGQVKEVIGVATTDKANTRVIIARKRTCVSRGR